jgi:hypothetical protein
MPSILAMMTADLAAMASIVTSLLAVMLALGCLAYAGL